MDTYLAMGWGGGQQESSFRVSEQYYPKNLQQINLTIESNLDCLSNSPDNTICIAIGQTNIGTICSEDSGGPLLIWDDMIQNWKQIDISAGGSGVLTFTGSFQCAENKGINVFTQVDKYQAFVNATIKPEQFLTQCATKYSDYVGQITSTPFICDEKYLCLNTSGGSLNIQQISILRDNLYQNLEYFTQGQWLYIPYENLGYCK